ncbi:type II secretion system secretin GspD [Geotalea uraniireducens]|uniref:General secretion pathway protein D n=1 Tax=Geotalea uraniireducens (strain Rf4) TaxID=351605 RepID=A5GC05_GEOUR|nr:type II secretion system secretin GspD [Geotalea uraniireducens]ABQ24895.1 general secretion pathway protein D [Geotalea uraniireducens Rf4]
MNKRISHIIIALIIFAAVPSVALAKGVVLNFSDVDISTMVKFISDLTGKNFVMDDRVKGKISVFSPAKLSTEEAFNVFTSVLELKGFTIVPAGKVLKIVPTANAKQSGMRIYSDKERSPVNEAYVARVITLDHISSQEAVTFLQPMVSKDGYISSFGPTNMLLLVDSSLNIQKILTILQLIDTDQKREGAELVFLKNASAESVANVVKEWLGSRDKATKPAGQPAAGAGGLILPDARLNALIIFGNAKDKDDIKKLITLIDVIPPTTSSKVNVYYLENADATEVAKVLDGVVKGSSAAAAPSQPGAANAPQQSPFEGGKISITPDKATNSLVIMASPTDYQNLIQVIQKLDKRRRQVFVEAVIAEVSLSKLKDLGVQWGVLGGASNGTATAAGLYDPQDTFTTLLTALANLKSAGITIPDLTGTALNFSAVLRALDSLGAVNVLSTPTIMTSDNKEAEIFVGENVPFKGNVTISNTTTPSFQSIERKDTGITLKITPQISEGEYVKLDIYQEISAISNTTVSGASDLITTKRSAKTSVAVKDKDTMVIGGLIQDREQETVNKIPLLGDIPFLGWLFKFKNTTRQKTNLLIVLTPRIVRGAQEVAEISEIQKQKFGNAVSSDKPFNLDKELMIKHDAATGDR